VAVRAHPAVTIVRANLVARTRQRRRRRRTAHVPLGRDFDPFAPEVLADPAAAYRRLHAVGGVHRCRRHDLFVLAGYEDVRAAARAHNVFSSAHGVSQVPAALPMLITSDRPRHGELRRMVAPHFTAESAQATRPLMERVTAEALERMLERPSSDAVAALAVPLPITVIAERLGVPASDLADFRRWSDGIIEGFHAGRSPAMLWRGPRVMGHVVSLHRYMRGVFDRLRRTPGDDVISALLVSQDGGSLNDEELFWFALMLLVAGNETTTNLIGSMLLALAEDPEAYDRLRRDPELVGQVVEESLRWGSPIQGLFRQTTEDHQVGDATIPAGSRVLLSFGAANRDPRQFPDPDRFDVERHPTDHLGFGFGIHFCLGAHLARLEAAVVLDALTARVARIEPAGPVEWTGNPTVRGPRRLPLRLVAA
jgi:beta-dihydromenaquinone-9 omega-hydroxylase